MKETKLSIKAILCLAWLIIGVATVFAGIIITAPNADAQFKSFIITSDASIARMMFESASFSAKLILKYLLIIGGAVITAVASIGFAGAMETAKLESLIYDDGEYDFEDEEGCNFDCSACQENCVSQEEEVEEISEEAVEEANQEDKTEE